VEYQGFRLGRMVCLNVFAIEQQELTRSKRTIVANPDGFIILTVFANINAFQGNILGAPVLQFHEFIIPVQLVQG